MSNTSTPPPGAVSVELPMMIASGRSLTSGFEGGDERMRMRLYKRNDGTCVGTAWFGEGAHGPPNHVHGGAVAYVLDEAMGSVAWMNDYPVVARKIDFEFLKMSPLKIEFTIEAKVLRTTERHVYVEAALILPDGTTAVKASGEFAILTKKKIDALDAAKYDPKALLQNPKLKWAKGPGEE
jgi:acyl-coenzyme A thioesterase PaaI-like protein